MNMNSIDLPRWVSALALGTLVLQNNSARADIPPPPAPATIRFQPVKATGLRVVTQYQGNYSNRVGDYGVCTTKNTGYSWVTLGRPVTYSMDIADWQAAGASLLLLAASQPVGAPSQATNALALSVFQLTNGNGYAQLFLTLNQSTNLLASLTTPSPLGSWSFTLQSDQVTLRGPSGVETTGQLQTNALAVFADPLFIYCFAPQQGWNSLWIPHPDPPDVTIGRIQVIGVPEPIDEQFSTAGLNTNIWQTPCPALDANRSMLVVPSGTQWYLCWPWLYYQGPHLLVSSTLAPGSWRNLGYATNVLDCLGYSFLPLPPAAPGCSFFRVLWDSETGWPSTGRSPTYDQFHKR